MILNTRYELSRTVHDIFLCRIILIVLFNEHFCTFFTQFIKDFTLHYLSNKKSHKRNIKRVIENKKSYN